MSIEAKHAYRFGYLKSEEWSNVRIAALARVGGKCEICGEESISNDAHHVWYPENIYETTEKNLVVLCRACHNFVHVMLPDCKTKDEEEGLSQWHKLRNAILVWRREKIHIFQTGLEMQPAPKAAQLRVAYEELKEKYRTAVQQLKNAGVSEEGVLDLDQEYEVLKSILGKWWKEKKNLTESNHRANQVDNCGISAPSQWAPKIEQSER